MPLPQSVLPALTGLSLLAIASVAACGGSASSGLPSDDGGAASETSAAADADVPSETGASPSDASAPVDAATVDGAAPDLRLDPIEVGRAWTYNVQVIGLYPACENGLGVATTLSKTQKDGKTALKVQSLCKDAGTFEYAVENDRVYYHHLGAWRLATDEPVVAGHTWSDDTYDYVWENAGTMTVAAGTFTDCWTARRQLPYDSFTTFCRGVGPVQWHFEDGFGNGYDALLANKNF